MSTLKTSHTTDTYLTTRMVHSKNSAILISIGDGLSKMVGLLTVATWNIAGRPSKPKKGTIGFNIQTQSLEIWDGSHWFTARLNPV